MAPKRQATSAAKAGGKKIKQSNKKVDECCQLSSCGEVYEDYDCILNQTNAGKNNNKFYVIQVIKANGKYYSWNRYGRVGEVGKSKLSLPFDKAENAVQDFEKKFKDKTNNNWSNRMNFVPHLEKYTLIEVDCVDGNPAHVTRNARCTLDEATQHLIKLIFNAEMFKDVMECMKLETGRMVLGKPSNAQIAKGFKVLEEIETAINQNKRKERLKQLSSKFYTTIPHNFGRKRPPIINDKDIVEKKKEMLSVLADIELSQILKSETEKAQEEMTQNVPHPIDQHYNSLNCKLTLMRKNEDKFKIIENYLKATSGNPRKLKILNVWKVDRETEGQRFNENDSINNRRLLWHGTNIAVVAAILKSGLRIMPHSGGRVGCGIYFASESHKSACYVRSYKNTGMMFLSEVALGKEHTITKENSSLTKPPVGHDSVVARGIVEPEPSKDIFITLEGKNVAVPQGKPKKQPKFSDSQFHSSEYLIYKESQCRLRYLLELNMFG